MTYDVTVDYYAVLGLTSTASLPDIRKAYHQLCRKFHPDRKAQANDTVLSAAERTVKTQELNQAYEIIGDSEVRHLMMADVNSMCCNCKDQKPHTRCSHEVHFTDEGPRYLYVHLKRYTRYSKLFTRVTCPENNGEVQIYDEHTKKNLRFRIESIVVHAGKDPNSGHYYSVGRNGTFNDKKVKFDEGKSFNTLLLDGVLRATEGFEDQRYDAYGYMYFLVEVPLTENISSSSSSSSSSSTSSSYSSPSSSSFSSST